VLNLALDVSKNLHFVETECENQVRNYFHVVVPLEVFNAQLLWATNITLDSQTIVIMCVKFRFSPYHEI
jgi:hypothetical protein